MSVAGEEGGKGGGGLSVHTLVCLEHMRPVRDSDEKVSKIQHLRKHDD